MPAYTSGGKVKSISMKGGEWMQKLMEYAVALLYAGLSWWIGSKFIQ